VLLVEDITDRVALERSARQAEKLAALGTLAAGLAHELNNPIGIISSRAELMLLDSESRPITDEVRDDLTVIHRHAQRVARIAQGLPRPFFNRLCDSFVGFRISSFKK
jgi:signal transduction histidine kinase